MPKMAKILKKLVPIGEAIRDRIDSTDANVLAVSNRLNDIERLAATLHRRIVMLEGNPYRRGSKRRKLKTEPS